MKLINECAKYMFNKGFKIYTKLSHLSLVKAKLKDKNWKLINKSYMTPKLLGSINQSKKSSVRNKVFWYSFIYDPIKVDEE